MSKRVRVQFGLNHGASLVGRIVGVEKGEYGTVAVETQWTLSDGSPAMAYVEPGSCESEEAEVTKTSAAATTTLTSSACNSSLDGGTEKLMKQSEGIPFHQAFQVLSSRPSCSHEHTADRPFFEGRLSDRETVSVSELPSFAPVDTTEVATWPALKLIAYLLQLQQKRAATYKYFDECFNVLLESRNITPYRIACQRITQNFSLLSQGVRFINAHLKVSNAKKFEDVCNLIGRLQKLEKEKLEVTAQFQLLQQHISNRGTQCNIGPTVAGQATFKELKHAAIAANLRLVEIVEDINDIVEDIRCERANLLE